MKKKLFLAIGALGAFALASCDAQDEKKINEAIDGKSEAEIIKMVSDANADANLKEAYKEGLKITADYKIKGNLNVSNYATGDLNLTGDFSMIYNETGVQANATAKLKSKIKVSTGYSTTESNINLKANATAESLNEEAYSYVYASVKGQAEDTKLDKEVKYKYTKDNSSTGDIELPDFGDLDIDISEFKAHLNDATITVDDGMLLFTWDTSKLSSLFDDVDNVTFEGLGGSVVVGFDTEFHLKKVCVDVKADKASVSYSGMAVSITDVTIYLDCDAKTGSYSIKSLKDKDSYVLAK